MAIPERSLVTAVLMGTVSAANACSCMPMPPLTQDWRKTPTIVEAEFVSATITVQQGEPIEDGVVRVTTRFKGPYKAGDLIRTRNNISGAACGLSLRGTPPAALEETNGRWSGPYWRWGAYDRWVLFLDASQPSEVSTCSRSKPSALFKERADLLKLQAAEASAPVQPKK